MYEAFFGLRERPFDLTPNPRYLFLTAKHREALSVLQYGLSAHKGVTLLIGDPGTGKTTLVNAALESQRGQDVFTVYLSNPTLTRDEFFEFLARTFGLAKEAAESKTRCVLDLTCMLVDRHAAGGATALIIDEAQGLPNALLEEVRLLANIESASEKLLSIILTGQSELAERLNESSLRQLKQRVGLRCTLSALTFEETAAYIATRVQIAGGDGVGLFTGAAVETIHECSRGIPRTVSVICDNALISGFALGERPIDRDIVLEVCRDFDFEPPPGTSPPARPSGQFFDAPMPGLSTTSAAAATVAPPAAPPAPQTNQATPADNLFGNLTRPKRFSFF